jgi:hypothetical protein
MQINEPSGLTAIEKGIMTDVVEIGTVVGVGFPGFAVSIT